MSGAGRPPYPPRVNTNAHSRVASSASPQASSSGTRHPVPPPPAQEGMSSRKRALESRSRGNSPPYKRPQFTDQASSRQHSGSLDKRPADPNAGEPSRDGALRRSSLPGPSRVQSPSADSSASTPAPTAPVVPGMLPTPAINLAFLRSLKRNKEAPSKTATPQGGQADLATPQYQKLENKISLQSKIIEELSGQIISLRLQLDPESAQVNSETLASLENRIVELEKSKDLPSKVEQLQTATKSHTAELATLTGLKTPFEELKQSIGAIKQDINDNKTQLQQNQNEVLTLIKDTKSHAQGIKLFDDFRKSQEKLSISSRLNTFSREISDFKKEQAEINIAPRLKNLSDDLADVRSNERKTYDKTCDIAHSLRRHIGLEEEDFEDFEHETLVERIDRQSAALKRLEKIQSERLNSSSDQEKLLANVEGLKKLQGEQSALSQKQGKLTAALAVLEKVQGEHTKTLEKQEKITPVVGKIQECQSDLFNSHEKLSLRQETQETRIMALENQDQPVSLQMHEAHTAQLKEFHDSVQTSTAKMVHLEQQLTLIHEQASALQIEKVNDDVQALVPRLAHLEQQFEKHDAQASALQVKQVNDGLQALVPRIAHLEQQSQKNDGLPEEITNLTTQIGQLEQRTEGLGHQMKSLNTIIPQAYQTDAGVITKFQTQMTGVTAEMEKLKKDLQGLSDEADQDRTDLLPMLREVMQPLKDHFMDQLREVNVKVDKCVEKGDTLELQQPPGHPVPDLAPLEEATKHFKAQLVQLQTARTDEATLREQEMLDIRNQLAEKAPTVVVDDGLNNLRGFLQGLQDQYNNITTDYLHGKMVHWFMETYPSDTAQALSQLASLQHDIQILQSTFKDTTWLQSKMQDLHLLLEMAPQLSALVQNAARLDTAIRSANEAKAKVDSIEHVLGKDGVNIQVLQDVQIMYPDLFRAIGQLQSAILSISQSLPLTSEGSQAVEFVFPVDFREPAQQQAEPSSVRSLSSARRVLNHANKGKARQQ